MTALATTATSETGPTPWWSSLRSLLESQREDCLRKRELALAETATSVPDAVAINRSASLLQTVREIDAALARMTAGSYGACTTCGGTIPAERLEFRPFAAGCVSCQHPRR